MDKMLAYCGINCTECPALIATQKDDDDERKKVAEQWSSQFHADIKAEDINCDGCLVDSGRLFGHCLECEIRACCRDKNLENCAYCDDYACEKLKAILDYVPDAKKRLDEIRNNLS